MEIKLTKASADGTGAFPPENVFVGDVFIVGILVVFDSKPRRLNGRNEIAKPSFDWHVITATESGWDDQYGETWGSWDPSDVEVWAKLPNRIES